MKDNNYFSINLKTLADKYSQKQVAIDTGISPASINNYLNKQSEPSASFLLKLKSAYKINIDEFLTRQVNFETTKTTLSKSLMRFAGNYIIYFYDTNVYKGRVSYSTNILKYGIITVVDENFGGSEALTVYGMFFDSRTEGESALKTINALKSSHQRKAYCEKQEEVYKGSLEQSATQVFISLKNGADFDHVSIILNNPPTNNEYIGGLGVVSSVSRGRERMPCIQYMLFSRNILHMPDGEIYRMLALGTPEISVHNESEQLIELFRNLYVENEQKPSHLNEYQKKRIVEDSLTNLIADVIEANMFRFAKVSNMEDDNYFRIIREVVDESDD